jgi:hypothetical protein
VIRRLVVALVSVLALVPGVCLPSPGGHGTVEPVAVGVLRPLQLVWDGRALVVLSPGARGESAGELRRVPVGGDMPVDLSHQAPTRIPFVAAAVTTLGSLALDPGSGALFMGEENGTRIWRLGADERLTLYANGLRRLAGGSTLAFDRSGRLVVLDYADPFVSPPDDHLPPGLEQLRDEAYRGPLVFRLTLDATLPLPRRVGNLAPLFPRAWGGPAGGGMLPNLISVASLPTGDLLLLASTGELYRLAENRSLCLFARLPRGQYNRTNMVTGPDGSVYVSGGFHVGQVFRVSPGGEVRVLASNLADPAGIAVDASGTVYIAESSRHRILRIR